MTARPGKPPAEQQKSKWVIETRFGSMWVRARIQGVKREFDSKEEAESFAAKIPGGYARVVPL